MTAREGSDPNITGPPLKFPLFHQNVVWCSVTSLLGATFHVKKLFSFHDPALGPEQTSLHQRETPAGGHAHAEEES